MEPITEIEVEQVYQPMNPLAAPQPRQHADRKDVKEVTQLVPLTAAEVKVRVDNKDKKGESRGDDFEPRRGQNDA